MQFYQRAIAGEKQGDCATSALHIWPAALLRLAFHGSAVQLEWDSQQQPLALAFDADFEQTSVGGLCTADELDKTLLLRRFSASGVEKLTESFHFGV